MKKATLNNEIISFSYENREGRKSRRSIDLETFKIVGNTLCVKGYCHLRNGNRIFAVKRMKAVKIVDQPGRCCFQ
ncbi:MAG: WYL domain-containing protein [Deltaproteobacteria bacterium]|nr:WYL domain-containing protein [Deltaproteobacteria bacterium]MBW1849219.1 WYL domain-containing protein [Deltaproteobacteria bacterium]MBW1969457.1 WYL domain-containing protein [Deltaproteobacteria bacterium]MBW2156388.1 WYL domain-containing protein [Deltaproteobacteria bacterium]MBW2196873.1 WYL domain-containing protein [Deltaproteobacteria bacterium]